MGCKATNLDRQIELLKKRGLIFDIDEDKAKEHLLDIGYYRLGFYWYHFEKKPKRKKVKGKYVKMPRTHYFKDNSKFSTIIDLYYLDIDIKHLLIKYINRIEVNFRTKLIYYTSNKYRDIPTWFVSPNVVSRDYINTFDNFYNEDFKRKNKPIKKHHKKYINDKYAPSWKTLEFFTFGMNLKLYKSIIDEDLKKEISKQYGVDDVEKFIEIMNMIVAIRNHCAHVGVLYDFNYSYSLPRIPVKFKNNNRQCLASCVQIILFILNSISPNRANELEEKFDKLIQPFSSHKDLMQIIKNQIGYKF